MFRPPFWDGTKDKRTYTKYLLTIEFSFSVLLYFYSYSNGRHHNWDQVMIDYPPHSNLLFINQPEKIPWIPFLANNTHKKNMSQGKNGMKEKKRIRQDPCPPRSKNERPPLSQALIPQLFDRTKKEKTILLLSTPPQHHHPHQATHPHPGQRPHNPPSPWQSSVW